MNRFSLMLAATAPAEPPTKYPRVDLRASRDWVARWTPTDDLAGDMLHRMGCSIFVHGYMLHLTAVRVRLDANECQEAYDPDDYEEVERLYALDGGSGPFSPTTIPDVPGEWLVFGTPSQ